MTFKRLLRGAVGGCLDVWRGCIPGRVTRRRQRGLGLGYTGPKEWIEVGAPLGLWWGSTGGPLIIVIGPMASSASHSLYQSPQTRKSELLGHLINPFNSIRLTRRPFKFTKLRGGTSYIYPSLPSHLFDFIISDLFFISSLGGLFFSRLSFTFFIFSASRQVELTSTSPQP